MTKPLKLAELSPELFRDYDGLEFGATSGPNPGMRELTCVHHQDLRILTKNPWQRGLHIVQPPEGFALECPCPFSDLRVILEDGE